jgi:uncharacterized integral membrane protein
MVAMRPTGTLIVSMLLINLIFLGGRMALAQTNKPVAMLDWSQILTIVGLGSIVSGLLVAVVNHYFTMRQRQEERKHKTDEEMSILFSTWRYLFQRMYDNIDFSSEAKEADVHKRTTY